MKKIFSFTILMFVINFLYSQEKQHVLTDTIYLKKKESISLKDKIFTQPIVIKSSPTALLYGGIFPFTSEYLVLTEVTSSRKHSEMFGVSYLGKSMLWKLIENANKIPNVYVKKVTGWKISYGHKFYLIKRRKYAPSGFFVGAIASYSQVHISGGLSRYFAHNYNEYKNFKLNGIIGIQVAKPRQISIEAYCGIGYKSNKVYSHPTSFRFAPINTSDYPPFFTTNLTVIFAVNIGYSF